VHELAQSVVGYIRKHDLIRAGDRVAIAVSGGADSVALLRTMLELRDELGIILFVAHLNHQIRGADSDADEQFVRELAKTHDLEVACETCDVKSFAAEKKLSLEAAAREARYEFFRSLLQSTVNRIATAHTLDDQAETVLLKLMRGAGTRGLAGIFPKFVVCENSPFANGKSGATIVRPLLGTRRPQLRDYLCEIGQPWREDASNQDLRHARNRVRREVLPQLERELNPSVAEVLAETAEVARAEEEYWDAEVQRVLPQVLSQDVQAACLRIQTLHAFPLALQRRLVRAAAESFGLTLKFSHVEEVLSLRHDGECLALSTGWTATRRREAIVFHRCSDAVRGYEYVVTVPGKVAVTEAGLALEVVLVDGKGAGRTDSADFLDSRFAGRALVVRNWRAGELFWPAHTKAPKKIKELLQDRHITGEGKRLWPVIASGDEIVWLRGFGVRRDLQAKSREGILIREVPEPQQ